MALVALVLVLPLVSSGCIDEVVPGDRPITVIEAYRAAHGPALGIDDTANLVGFVGHEGPTPTFLEGVLSHYVVAEDTSRDADRGDGRALVWSLLFATAEGGLVQSIVRADPLSVDTTLVSESGDDLLQDLWALNMGGRLLVDTPAAVASVRASGTPTATWLDAHPDANIVYASSVVPQGQGEAVHDLVHELYFGYADGPGYAHYAQVDHDTGVLVAEGEEKVHEATRRVTLVDRSFRLTPLVPSAEVQEELPTTVRAVELDLVVAGTGRFDLSISGADGTVVRIQDDVLTGEKDYEEPLGVLPPDTYTLQVSTTGDLTFDLKITGIAGL